MSDLKTNFNITPYFDDYDDDKKFYRILFNPRRAVQARELTQLQTILQRQISRFGSHVYKDGSIVDGVAISYIPKFDFVHLENNFNNGNFTVASQIDNSYLITNSLDSNTAVRAVPVLSKDGFVGNYPNTNRFYLRYVTTGKNELGNDQSTFVSGDTLFIFDSSQNNFETLDANNVLDSIDVITSNATANSTGVAYGVSVSDGIVFQKGHFIKVDSQTITVKDFDREVDNYAVGFDIRETIVNSSQDVSLKDQAAGFTNFNAPGADRLLLNAVLISENKDNIDSDEFFSIVDFDGDSPAQNYQDPVYNRLGYEMARRTFEQSGDFYTRPFQIETVPAANTQKFTYEVATGLSYIQGNRVEFIGTNRVTVDRAITTDEAQNQITTANYGAYVVIDEYVGSADLDNIGVIDLYDQPQNSISEYEGATGGADGNLVGRANVQTIVHKTGIKGKPDTRYLLYLTNIQMETNKSFSDDAKSFVATSPRGVRGDFVLENQKVVIKDINNKKLLFETGFQGVRRLTNSAGVNDTSYVYRQTSSATLQANGFVTFTLNTPAPGANESLNFSVGTVSEPGKGRFNISLSANAFTSNNSGTLDVVSGNTTIVGSNTNFTSEFSDDDLIRINLGGSTFTIRRVEEVVNSTVIIIDSEITTSNNAANYQKYFVSGSVLNLTGANNTINVISNTQFQVSTDLTLDSGSQTVFGQYPVLRNLANPASKQIRKNRLVKIDVATNDGGMSGPWNLGFVDVRAIRNVWIGTTYANTNPDVSSWFIIDNGQRDEYYEHARMFIRPDFASRIKSDTKLLINLDHFVANTSAGVGFFSVDSYPIDDVNSSNTNAILTAQIPTYSAENGKYYDLRNTIDFRPQKFNTATSVANTNPANTSITINPATSNNSFNVSTGGHYLIEIDTNFRADIEYYLARIDLVTVDKNGNLSVNQGIPDGFPRNPFNEGDSSIIARAFIPPFPSLSQRESEILKRRDLAIKTEQVGNKRFTMRDIGILERRIKRLEYYTVLNTLEQKSRDLKVPDENGLDRFKNGIFAEPFNGHEIGKTTDFEYNISIDRDLNIARPKFSTQSIDLLYNANSSSNVTRTGSYVTLTYTDELYVDQPYASKVRNATELEWQWTGKIELHPDQDFFNDEKFEPNLNIPLDLATPWENFLNSPFAPGAIFGGWRTISSQSSQSSGTTVFATPGDGQGLTPAWLTPTGDGGNVSDLALGVDWVNETTTSNQQRIVQELGINITSNVFDLGTNVTDFSIQPYMRTRNVAFIATSMKPNTRVFPFFDEIPVSAHVAPGVLSGIEDFYEGNENDIVRRTGNYGDSLTTDSNGFICGIFRIPENSFRVGDRAFSLYDIDDLTIGFDGVITKASGTFSASNVSVTKRSSTITTREPRLITNSFTEDRTVVSTERVSEFFWCPISQGFFVDVPSDVSGMYVDKIGLFFRTKDANLGCTVALMEMREGFPDTTRIIGEAKLTSAEINAPGDNTQVETVFNFLTPVFVNKRNWYAFMVLPDGASPNYTFWMAELGGFDVVTGKQIFRNPYAGDAFRSSNQVTWTPIANETVKFNIYRSKFNTSPGIVTLNNQNDDYLIVDEIIRANTSFGIEVGDVVYAVNATSNNTMVEANDPFGIVKRVDEAEGIIDLGDSSGNFEEDMRIRFFRVADEDNVSQIVSGNLIASGKIETIRNISINALVPRIAKLSPIKTNIKFEYRGTDSNGVKDTIFLAIENDTEREFTDKERFIYSKSNENGNKSNEFRLTLSSVNSYVSPVVDLNRKAALCIENIINNDSTNEHTRYGNAKAKYLSKNSILADGQEAEDLRIYLTAYRPVDTDIEVYVKFHNPEDREPFNDKLWTKLNYFSGEFTFSNSNNFKDIKEYEFEVPFEAAFTNSAFRDPSTGIIEYTNNDGSRFLSFKTYSIKIVLLSSNKIRIPKLNDLRAIALQI
jgi:hypothetical protein